MPQQLVYNGKLVSADEPVLKTTNRAFRFGDSVFETVRVLNGQPLFLTDHFSRLIKAMNAMKMDVPSEYTVDFFGRQINDLLVANLISTGARVRLTVFRNEGGFYTPKTNECSYLIESDKLEDNLYALNSKGHTIDLFSDIKKQQNSLSSVKTGNSSMFVLAGIHRVKNNLDECIVMNTKNDIIESINSNVFAVKNGVLYTPPVAEGCIDGVMRKKLIEVSFKSRIAVYEINLAQSVLLSADELFLTNVVSGIRWVGAYKSKRFFNNTAKLLVERLNEYITAKKET